MRHNLNRFTLCAMYFRFDAVHVVPGPENGTFYVRAMNLGDAIFKVRIAFGVLEACIYHQLLANFFCDIYDLLLDIKIIVTHHHHNHNHHRHHHHHH